MSGDSIKKNCVSSGFIGRRKEKSFVQKDMKMTDRTCGEWLKSRVGRVPILAALAGMAAACSPLHGLAPLPQVAGTYHLGAGDKVRVLTYNDTQLSNTFLISDAGNIAFPLMGTVKAAGETPQGLADELSQALSARGILHKPSISVEVAEYRPVFILGEVNRPGQYEYIPGMTMQSAVALAGGYTYRAITSAAGAVRTEGVAGGQPVSGKVTPATLLAPGDVITVYERYF